MASLILDVKPLLIHSAGHEIRDPELEGASKALESDPLFLHKRKLRPRKVMCPAQGHKVSQWQRQDLNPPLLQFQSTIQTTTYSSLFPVICSSPQMLQVAQIWELAPIQSGSGVRGLFLCTMLSEVAFPFLAFVCVFGSSITQLPGVGGVVGANGSWPRGLGAASDGLWLGAGLPAHQGPVSPLFTQVRAILPAKSVPPTSLVPKQASPSRQARGHSGALCMHKAPFVWRHRTAPWWPSYSRKNNHRNNNQGKLP